MTSILAQTVYGLNLLDLPLDRLERGDPGRTVRRLGSTKDVPCSRRLDSFSAINILTVSMKVPQRRDTTDAHVRPRIKKPANRPPHISQVGKSNTEDSQGTPKIDKYYQKKNSLPADLEDVRMVTSGPPTLDIVTESRESSNSDSPEYPLPMRSVTTTTLVSDSILGKNQNQGLLAPQGIPSPGAQSLPAEFILEEQKTVDNSPRQRKISQDNNKGSMFTNHNTNTPSPDAILAKNQTFFPTDGHKKRSNSPNSRHPLKPLIHDLILTNVNISDTEQDPVSNDPRGSTSVDSPLIQSTLEEPTDSDMIDGRRLSHLRKSSSDGNINRITISSDVDPVSIESEYSKTSNALWRLSSTSVNKDSNVNSHESFSHASSSPSMSPPVVSKEFHLPKTSHSPPKLQGGWTAESAAIVWQRMLKVLGDVNKIQNPAIHADALGCLDDTWQSLATVSIHDDFSLGMLFYMLVRYV